MTIIDGLKVPISSDSDVISVRQYGRSLAEKAGFRGTDLTVIATAISDVARKIAEYAPPGEIDLAIREESGKVGIVVTARSFSKNGSQGHWLPGARRLRRLMDELEIIAKPEETAVTMKKWKQPVESVIKEIPVSSDAGGSGGYNGSLLQSSMLTETAW